MRSACLLAAAFAVASIGLPTGASVAVGANHASTLGGVTRAIPRPAHTVVVMMENHSYSDIIGNRQAPYLNALAKAGALFTHSFAITHPSQPNYLALFSGSTQGVTGDACPHTFRGRNIGREVRAAHHSFVGYSESLPVRGFTGCVHGEYARKHNPWVDFSDLPRSTNRPLSALPRHLSAFPTLAFITPNLRHDMHDGTIAQADHWLKRRLGSYIRAARHHDDVVIITWDENDYSESNQIPTIVIGGHVRPGRYSERIDHYSVLRTLEAAYGLPPIGLSRHRRPILDIWKR